MRNLKLLLLVVAFCIINYFGAITTERAVMAEWSIFMMTACTLVGLAVIWGIATLMCKVLGPPPKELPKKKRWHTEFSELSFWRLGQRLKGGSHG